MDGQGYEISNKIRNAIKAKLQELGCYVDEELPEYVMVMIANKKSKQQMTDDLNLFLGKNSDAFTNWLHDILDRLQKITSSVTASAPVVGVEQKPIVKVKPEKTPTIKADKTRSPEPKHTSKRRSDEVTLAPAKTVRRSDSNDRSTKGRRKNDRERRVSDHHNRSPSGPRKVTKNSENENRRHKYFQKSPVRAPAFTANDSLRNRGRSISRSISPSPPRFSTHSREKKQPPTNVVRPFLREDDLHVNTTGRSTVSQVNRQPSTQHTVSSVVKVTERKSTVPASLQPKSAIFLKALHAANASVATVEKVQTEPQLLENTGPQVDSLDLSGDSFERRVEEITADTIDAVVKRKKHSKSEKSSKKKKSKSKSRKSKNSKSIYDRLGPEVSDTEEPIEKDNEVLNDNSDDDESPVDDALVVDDGTERNVVTRFVVTLDGLDPNWNKPKLDSTIEAVASSSKAVVLNYDNEYATPEKNVTMAGPVVKEEPEIPAAALVSITQPQPLPNTSTQSTEPVNVIVAPPVVVEGHVDQALMPLGLFPVNTTAVVASAPLQNLHMPVSASSSSDAPQMVTPTQIVNPVNIDLTNDESGDEEDDHRRMNVRRSMSAISNNDKLERCLYWPACKQKDICPYHHPTVLCSSFPFCRFGDKCLYIHPNCKYDTSCKNRGCPYTHTTRNRAAFVKPAYAQPAPMVEMMYGMQFGPNSQMGGGKLPISCKYGNQCQVESCPFKHPKTCKFGSYCSRPDCRYFHAPKSKFKWQPGLAIDSALPTVPVSKKGATTTIKRGAVV